VKKTPAKSIEKIDTSNYQNFGWQHELWDVVRYFRSIGKNEKKLRKFWLNHLKEKSSLAVIVSDKGSKKLEIHGAVPLKQETIDLFLNILLSMNINMNLSMALLNRRTSNWPSEIAFTSLTCLCPPEPTSIISLISTK
jgi:hypothetical protein